jgi:hypothetical protein
MAIMAMAMRSDTVDREAVVPLVADALLAVGVA